MASIRIGETWRLYRDQELLGELVVTDADFPWLTARFEAAPTFETVRPLFEEELRLTDALDDDADDSVEAWEAAYDRIRAAVSLAAPDGRRVPEFLLHIQGEEAWWRWSDAPFPA